MLRNFRTVIVALLMIIGATTARGAVVNVFDEDSGANSYSGGLGSFNWVENIGGLSSPNSGSEFFASAFIDANGLGLTKTLGGTVDNATYDVSFRFANYAGRTPLVLSDFAILNIGAQGGTTMWTSTPAITTDLTWFVWEGVYTPDASEIGSPFVFEFLFGPTDSYAFAIDGPVTATPRMGVVPLPASFLLLAMSVGAFAVFRRLTIA
jgi:hypothetical protein